MVKRHLLTASTAAIAACLVQSPAAAQVVPRGGTVVEGSATIDAPSAGRVTVTQTSNRAIVNWSGFSIGQGGRVTFNQPDAHSVTLNRVVEAGVSSIDGTISSNGAVYLVNPNGIAIGSTGVVDTRGGFIASTRNITDAGFMAGDLDFAGAARSGVTNAGSITSPYVALLGGFVANTGTITAPAGKVALAAADYTTVDLSGDGFLQVALPTDATDASGVPLVSNSGIITADGGRVTLTAAVAANAVRRAVNMSGVIEARTVGGKNGSITLSANGGGSVTVGETARISATGGEAGATGGAVTILAGGAATVGGRIEAFGYDPVHSGTTDFADVAGGRIDITGDTVTVNRATILNNKGLTRIGGGYRQGASDDGSADYQLFAGRYASLFGGLEPLALARTVRIDSNSTVNLHQGGGLTVASRDDTSFGSRLTSPYDEVGLIAFGDVGGALSVSSGGILSSLAFPAPYLNSNRMPDHVSIGARAISIRNDASGVEGGVTLLDKIYVEAITRASRSLTLEAGDTLELRNGFRVNRPQLETLNFRAGRGVTISDQVVADAASLVVTANDPAANGGGRSVGSSFIHANTASFRNNYVPVPFGTPGDLSFALLEGLDGGAGGELRIGTLDRRPFPGTFDYPYLRPIFGDLSIVAATGADVVLYGNILAHTETEVDLGLSQRFTLTGNLRIANDVTVTARAGQFDWTDQSTARITGYPDGRADFGADYLFRTWNNFYYETVAEGRVSDPAFVPKGGIVTHGSAMIDTPSAGRLTVAQSSARAVIDWNSFGLGAGNTVTFSQPDASSVVLNRVTGGTASLIDGTITANGAVYLVNPNGIAIGPTGVVDTRGGFVASSRGLSGNDFMAGRLNFAAAGSTGVSLDGSILAGGDVSLLGGFVTSTGTITADGRAITLDAGPGAATISDGTLQADGGGRIDVTGDSVTITGGSLLAQLGGLIRIGSAYRYGAADDGSNDFALFGRPNGATPLAPLATARKVSIGASVGLGAHTVLVGSSQDTSFGGFASTAADGGAWIGSQGVISALTATSLGGGQTAISAPSIVVRFGGGTAANGISYLDLDWLEQITNRARRLTVEAGDTLALPDGFALSTALISGRISSTQHVSLRAGRGITMAGSVDTWRAGLSVIANDVVSNGAGRGAGSSFIDTVNARFGIGSLGPSVTVPPLSSLGGNLSFALLAGHDNAAGGELRLGILDKNSDWRSSATFGDLSVTTAPGGTIVFHGDVNASLDASHQSDLGRGFTLSGPLAFAEDTIVTADAGAFNWTDRATTTFAPYAAGRSPFYADYLFRTWDGASYVNLAAGRATADNLLPFGGTVAAGEATIAPVTGHIQNIFQTSKRAVIDWLGFSVGAADVLNFLQPDETSVTLNRVAASGGRSTLDGQINANGAVYLINPNGIAIGSGGVVDTRGGFLAASRPLGTTDFMNGVLAWGQSPTSLISNLGRITVGDGATATLLGGSVENGGTIAAGSGGRIALLASGNGTVSLGGTLRAQGLMLGARDVAIGDTQAGVTPGLLISAADLAKLGTSFTDLSVRAEDDGGVVSLGAIDATSLGSLTIAATDGAAVRFAGNIAANALTLTGSLQFAADTAISATTLNWTDSATASVRGWGMDGVNATLASNGTTLFRGRLNDAVAARLDLGGLAGSSFVYGVETADLAGAALRLRSGSLVPGDTFATLLAPGSIAISGAPQGRLGVGTYAVAVSATNGGSPAGDRAGYFFDLAPASGTLSITPRSVNYAISNSSSTYGTLATISPVFTGVLAGDDLAGSLLVRNALGLQTLTDRLAAGSYTVDLGGLTGTASANYVVATSGNSDGALTVAPRGLNYVGPTIEATYGDLARLTGGVLTGLLQSDLVGVELALRGQDGLFQPTDRLSSGSYAIVSTGLSGEDAANYTLAASADGLLSVAQRALSLSLAGATYRYGSPATLATLSGVLSGDSVGLLGTVDGSAVALAPVGGGWGLQERAAVGSYGIAVTGLGGSSAANYSLAASAPVNAEILPRLLNWNIGSVATTYGTRATPTVSLLNLLQGDVASSAALASRGGVTEALSDRMAAGTYLLTAGALTGAQANNYALATDGNSAGTLTIARKALSYAIGSYTGIYGSPVSVAPSFSGLIAGDEVSGLVEAIDAGGIVTLDSRMAVGGYGLRLSGLGGAAADNYVLATDGSSPGSLTISPKAISFVGPSLTSTYGVAATLHGGSFTGVLAGDELSAQLALIVGAGIGQPSDRLGAGSYVVRATGLTGAAAGNYSLAAASDGLLTIGRRELTAAAFSPDYVYGAPAPILTLQGILDGDGVAPTVNLSTAVTTLARVGAGFGLTERQAAGSYAFIVTGLAGSDAGNYSLVAGEPLSGRRHPATRAWVEHRGYSVHLRRSLRAGGRLDQSSERR